MIASDNNPSEGNRGFSSVFYSLILMKDPEKALAYLSDLSKYYNPDSVEELEYLHEPITECMNLGKAELASKMLSFVSTRVELPYLAVVSLLAPQLMTRNDKILHFPEVTEEVVGNAFIERNLFQKMGRLPSFNGILGTEMDQISHNVFRQFAGSLMYTANRNFTNF